MQIWCVSCCCVCVQVQVCVFTSTCSSLAVAAFSSVGTVHSRVFPIRIRLSQLWLETVRTWHFMASLSIRSPCSREGGGADRGWKKMRENSRERKEVGRKDRKKHNDINKTTNSGSSTYSYSQRSKFTSQPDSRCKKKNTPVISA